MVDISESQKLARVVLHPATAARTACGPQRLGGDRRCSAPKSLKGSPSACNVAPTMPKRFYGKRDADAAADDEQVDAVLQRAQPDDVPKPAAVYNTSALQFGVLCSIFDELERATRTRRKHKAESKADMVAHFFLVSAYGKSYCGDSPHR